MKKPGNAGSASNVFSIRSKELLPHRNQTDRGFPAVIADTSSKIKKILDEAGDNNIADNKLSDAIRSRYKTPATPIDTDTLRQSIRSDLPPSPPLATVASSVPAAPAPAPRPSGKRYSVIPKPPIEEVIDAPFSQKPSDIPPSRKPILPNRRTVTDAFNSLSPSVRGAIIELEITKENNDLFLTRYRELKSSRDVIPTLINGLSTLLNERVIDLPPQFIYKGSKKGDTKWVIIECTEDSLDNPFPMVQVLPEDKLNFDDESPVSVPLRIVFMSNLIQ